MDDAPAGGAPPDDTGVDFALAVLREDDQWQVVTLPPRVGDSLDDLLQALLSQGSEAATLGFVSVGDEFFVAVKVIGADTALLLSDAGAAVDWPLAQDVLVELGLDEEDVDVDEEVEPAGDLAIFADYGMPAMEMAMLCSDVDLYPDEQIASVASRLGFGDAYDAAVGSRE